MATQANLLRSWRFIHCLCHLWFQYAWSYLKSVWFQLLSDTSNNEVSGFIACLFHVEETQWLSRCWKKMNGKYSLVEIFTYVHCFLKKKGKISWAMTSKLLFFFSQKSGDVCQCEAWMFKAAECIILPFQVSAVLSLFMIPYTKIRVHSSLASTLIKTITNRRKEVRLPQHKEMCVFVCLWFSEMNGSCHSAASQWRLQ